jgi:uracil-DNA glycosylase
VSVEDRARLVTVLERLRALGVDELYLDTLGSREALAMAAGAWRAAPTTHSSSLDVLAADAAGCQLCGLSAGRTQVVYGRGSASAELVVVGEAPGAEEDRQGLPFVGPAGRLLDLLLLSVGFDRDSVYICNVLKCRPPNNRDPRPDEVAACAPHLHAQLDALAPKAVLAVGRFASQMLTGSEASMGQLRGRVHEFRGVPVVATYHPAYLLRTPSATRTAWLDLQRLRQVFDEYP